MTKYESEILKYLKQIHTADRINVLKQFGEDNFIDRASGTCSLIRHEDRLDCLIASGCIGCRDASLHITPKGLHELDEYLENQTRLRFIEWRSWAALIISLAALLLKISEYL